MVRRRDGDRAPCARSTGQEGFRAAQERRRRYLPGWPRVAGVAAAVHRTHRGRRMDHICVCPGSGGRQSVCRADCGRATFPAGGQDVPYKNGRGYGGDLTTLLFADDLTSRPQA